MTIEDAFDCLLDRLKDFFLSVSRLGIVRLVLHMAELHIGGHSWFVN